MGGDDAGAGPSVPGRDLGIRVVGRREIGAHGVSEDTEERLERGLAVARHIPIHADARNDAAPRENIQSLERLRAAELSGSLRLFRYEIVIALPPDAVGQRHPSQ